jgi:predicted transcriptional regulator
MFFGGLVNGLWIAFIGWFLNNAAQSSYQQVVLRERLAGLTARDVMTRQCPTVPSDLGLDRLVHEYVLGTGHRCFFVAEDGDLKGLITLGNIKAVPQAQRNELTVGQVMTPVDVLLRARSDEDVLALLRRMDEADVHQIPVIDSGRPLGVFSRENLLHHLRLRSELGA